MEYLVEASNPTTSQFLNSLMPSMINQLGLNHSRRAVLIKVTKEIEKDMQGATLNIEIADCYLVLIKKPKRITKASLLDMGTTSSLRICIGKPCGGIRPLTVGHDDNVFLNGIAQQAIQQEIARLNVLPENVCSYQKGKGCADATIVNCVVKEVALQNNEFFLAEIDDDAEKMFDRLYLELQAILLMLAGAGIQGFTEWQCANMVDRTNTLVTDIF